MAPHAKSPTTELVLLLLVRFLVYQLFLNIVSCSNNQSLIVVRERDQVTAIQRGMNDCRLPTALF